jgi:hypothetical protein
MPRVYTLIFVLCVCAAHGQQPSPAPEPQPADSQQLPDSPGALAQATDRPLEGVVAVAKHSFSTSHTAPPPCRSHWMRRSNPYPDSTSISSADPTPSTASPAPASTTAPSPTPPSPASPLDCVDILNPYVRFLDTRFSIPMTPPQKAYLAFRNVVDPFNLATITATSGFTIGIDSHTAYGPGWKGFGKNAGDSLLQDATGEFFGTFVIPSVTHEDPHYHRLPRGTVPQRLFHAISRTVVSQHDDGTSMPNYATLLTYPITSEISNLYVPGIQTDGPSTAIRILTGYALDPVNNLVTEFLPDVAKRVHIRVIFVQRILNQVVVNPASTGQTGP